MSEDKVKLPKKGTLKRCIFQIVGDMEKTEKILEQIEKFIKGENQ